MYELSRIRLHSVGPKGARYQDVTIDLRDVGQPVLRPTQGALFDVDTTATPTLRRPSPASVVFLENGGGKTVLMRLIFSVMLPGRRNVLGSSSSRTLEDYVLAEDLAQVALEWQHTRTGARVVTGKASEWRGRVVSTDSSRLSELWYVFRSTAGFSLDTLPFTEDGRLVTLAGFKERLERANRAEPQSQVGQETSHRAWIDKLVNLDLDPELFRYQRSMNAGEGEAADAFTFRTDEAFVDFLLRAVTNDEDPNGVAEILAGYASKIASQKDLLAERDFVDGARKLIEPLAVEAANAKAARQLNDEAHGKARRLTDSLRTRHTADIADLSRASAELQEAQRAESVADHDMRRVGEVLLELRRLVAGLRLTAAQQEEAGLKTRHKELDDELSAWEATGTLVALQEANAAENAIRELVEEQKEQARPALEARDIAAITLARALLHVKDSADARQREADAAAEAFERAAGNEDRNTQDAVRRATQASADAARLRATIERHQGALRTAVEEGILAAVSAIDEATKQAKAKAVAAGDRLAEAHARVPELARKRKAAQETLTALQREDSEARNGARVLTDRLATATARTTTLAAKPRLADVLGAEAIDLDTDAEALVERLATAVAAADERRARLMSEQSADQRVLTALGDRGLLPPNSSVAAALEVLESNKISAWPGWTYLSKLAPDQREATIRHQPLLVDGIVLNSQDNAERARDLLTEARLVPPTIVAVGTTAAMLEPGAEAAEFVVPPNPALFDEQAADAERERLAETFAHRAERIADLERSAGDDRALTEQVKSWRADLPIGELARMRTAAEQATAAAAEAAEAVTAAKDACDTAEAAEEELRTRIPQLIEQKDRAGAVARRLEELAQGAAEIPGLQLEQQAQRATAATAESERVTAEQEAAGLRARAAEQRSVAADSRRVRDAAQDEFTRVPGAGSVSTDVAVAGEPLTELRSRYEAAAEAFRKVEVGDDLLSSLKVAQMKAAGARGLWEAVAESVRVRAGALLYTPDGADAAGRSAAAERIRSELRALAARIEEVVRRVGELANAYGQFIKQDRVLDPYGRPLDIAHGESLISRAEIDYARAREALARIADSRGALQEAVTRTQSTVEGFQAVLESLSGVAPATEDVQGTPFALGLDEARAQRAEVLREVAEAKQLHDDAARNERAAADKLAQYSQDARFEEVRSPVRRQILAVNRDTMPQYGEQWEQALRPRLRTLNDDLAQIGEHRSGIVTRLQGLVDNGLRTLRQAQRLSKLPPALGDWAGQEFLRIHFAESDPAAVHERLGQVVDETASALRDDKHRQRIDGMAIVLKGVFAAMPKGVTVEMLKPDTVLRNERVRVAHVHDVFSGGQHLTAAIILYCTMAALRANERGQTGRSHAGVLFLDNPIGRASAGYLLDLQLAVAKALGVQLVYTTGLFDINALSVFPLIVRLRNDADLRAGLKYLSIDDEIRRPLADIDQGPADEHKISATRLFVRPREGTS